MERSYIKKVWDVILFFGIWIGIPVFLANHTGENTWYISMVIMWLPAWMITTYLLENNNK
tara:strand:+ start:489 stop:668 length:180 start_codon:yes stop_codon:yes gene_type:complete